SPASRVRGSRAQPGQAPPRSLRGSCLAFSRCTLPYPGVSAKRVNPKVAKEKPMNGWRRYSVRQEGATYGARFGSALAMAISYNTNHSILWEIVHGIFSWIYVVSFALFYRWPSVNPVAPRHRIAMMPIARDFRGVLR